MSTALAEQRRTRAFRLGVIALLMALIAAITLGIHARSLRPDLAAGPVVPGLSERIAQARRISIVSHDATYRIEKLNRGDHEMWVMRDRGDFPVLAAPLAALSRGLENLQLVRRMTSDPSKHERLGVGDPRQDGGGGVLVQVEDGQGALLVNLILGVEPNGLYARRPDDNQTWAVRGDLPPLRDVSTWLDLRPTSLAPLHFARVEIMPREGRAYILSRAAPDDADFAIVAPARLEPLSRSAVSAVASHLTQLAPNDVQPAPAINGTPFARLRATTFDGVMLDCELIENGGRSWIKIVARGAHPEQEPAALAINQQVAAWAYGVSDGELNALAPSLASLLPQAPPSAPRAPPAPVAASPAP